MRRGDIATALAIGDAVLVGRDGGARWNCPRRSVAGQRVLVRGHCPRSVIASVVPRLSLVREVCFSVHPVDKEFAHGRRRLA